MLLPIPFAKGSLLKTNRDAYGIVFLSEIKAGVLIGGKAGTGIIIGM